MSATSDRSDNTSKSRISVKDAVDALEALVGRDPGQILDGPQFPTLAQEMRQLHARFRAHHTANILDPKRSPATAAAPELTEQFDRLRSEHPRILGQLDWLIRHVDDMPDRALEDREVFTLRVREVIAVLRRHEAEEERLVDMALWRDTGGLG